MTTVLWTRLRIESRVVDDQSSAHRMGRSISLSPWRHANYQRRTKQLAQAFVKCGFEVKFGHAVDRLSDESRVGASERTPRLCVPCWRSAPSAQLKAELAGLSLEANGHGKMIRGRMGVIQWRMSRGGESSGQPAGVELWEEKLGPPLFSGTPHAEWACTPAQKPTRHTTPLTRFF